MAETAPSTKPDERVLLVHKQEAPKRPLATIEAELDAANKQLLATLPRVEAERARKIAQDLRIEKTLAEHRSKYGSSEPFDPNIYNPPMVPYTPDPALCREFHAQHYAVADLEREKEAHFAHRRKGGVS